MKNQWLRIAERFDGLESRERMIVAITVAMIIVLVFAQFVWYPRIQTMADLRRDLGAAAAALPAKESALIALEEKAAQDPNQVLRDRAAELERALVLQQKAYFEQLDYLVSPAEMVNVLYDVLGTSKGIELVSLENLPAEPLSLDAGASDQSGERVDDETLYRHRVRLEFKATYFDTIDYFRKLERVGDRLVFKSLSYEVDAYPKARVVVIVETLGMETGWIGV